MLMCMQDIVIIQGIVGLTGMRFALNAFVNNVSGVFISLGVPNTSLQFIVVDIQLSEFLLMAAFHLCDAGLELVEGIIVCHGPRRGIGIF